MSDNEPKVSLFHYVCNFYTSKELRDKATEIGKYLIQLNCLN